jgi:hypothetical protein
MWSAARCRRRYPNFGLLDANEIAADEYTQFLGTSFVNNPSIQYPSFALGANYQIDFTAYFGYQGSTHET